jgi:hypothetical protein
VSDANAEVVREAFLASAGGDPTAGERFYDPSLEWDMSGVIGWPEKPVYRGREEVVPFMQAWADSWQDWHYEVEDVREAGSERVFLALHEWGIGVGSGASVDQSLLRDDAPRRTDSAGADVQRASRGAQGRGARDVGGVGESGPRACDLRGVERRDYSSWR